MRAAEYYFSHVNIDFISYHVTRNQPITFKYHSFHIIKEYEARYCLIWKQIESALLCLPQIVTAYLGRFESSLLVYPKVVIDVANSEDWVW